MDSCTSCKNSTKKCSKCIASDLSKRCSLLYFGPFLAILPNKSYYELYEILTGINTLSLDDRYFCPQKFYAMNTFISCEIESIRSQFNAN